MKRVKLYLEQARAETMTLLAESQVGCKELMGNHQSREMIALDRMRLTDPLKRNLYSYRSLTPREHVRAGAPNTPPSSRGLGRHPFKVEIAGSNPAGGTRVSPRDRRS